MTTRELFGGLSGVKGAGQGQWSALCPVHADRRARLYAKIDSSAKATIMSTG